MHKSGPNNGYLLVSFKGNELYSSVGVALSKVPINPYLLGRKMYKAEFFVSSSTQEYLDFLEYSRPSLSISQTKPIYSNFANSAAIGIFTFRGVTRSVKNMHSNFINGFSRNPNTCIYKFYTNNLVIIGCQP